MKIAMLLVFFFIATYLVLYVNKYKFRVNSPENSSSSYEYLSIHSYIMLAEGSYRKLNITGKNGTKLITLTTPRHQTIKW